VYIIAEEFPAVAWPGWRDAIAPGARLAARRRTVKTQAAVLWQYGQDWQIEELDLDDPWEGEVMVRLAASGLCHSDEHVRVGDLPLSALPAIGGHEGAGADLGGFCMLGTFPERAVVSQASCVRIDREVAFEVAALVGCGVPTGWGTSRAC
jgi:Zn-dependent alcohol dehydrogenase